MKLTLKSCISWVGMNKMIVQSLIYSWSWIIFVLRYLVHVRLYRTWELRKRTRSWNNGIWI